jgi:1-acyl-sn-glycerol-3-phosphate acyltransferase
MSTDLHLELNPKKSVFYYVVSFVLRGLATLLFRPSITGADNIPLTGPVLVAPIHRSNLDFAFSLFMSPRKTFFMAKDSLFKIPVLGPALISLGAFPVARGSADREAMRAAESVLQAGHALIMFPEGTRKYGPTVEDLHDGAMFIAARTGASVVPVGIAGTESVVVRKHGIPRLSRVRMVVGTPIAPVQSEGRPARSAVAAKTEELRSSLEAVYQESLRN